MLLHEHALAERTGAPVNSIWFHGGGGLPAPATLPDVAVHAHGGRGADVARGLAALRGEPAPASRSIDAVLGDRRDAIVALAPVTAPDTLESIARGWLVPALDRLDANALSSVGLIASDAARAASWEARPHGWLARWKQRHTRFSAPAHER
jgi:chloramphenicol 3-O-phosphotransferase